VRNTKLIWQLFPSHILILLAAMLAIGWYGTQSIRSFYVQQMGADLEARSRLIEQRAIELLVSGKVDNLIGFCKESGRRAATRITIIDPQGTVLCDSVHDPRTMENHAARPEIIQAHAGNPGTAMRYSTTTRQDMLYVAIPLKDQDAVRGVLRTAIPLTSIDDTLSQFFFRITMGILLVTVLAAGMTLLVSRKVSQPLEKMKQGAMRFASGDFSTKITASGSEEIVGLAQAMNRMATQLNERIRTVVSQRNELQTVVSSMIEGVMAVNLDEKIMYMNEAATRQLSIGQSQVKERNLPEIVRNVDLLRFIQKTLAHAEPVEGTVVLNRGRADERFLQVHGAQLIDAKKKRIGALIVTNDVTRLLRLENMRRDFVANVSHELKTPITSIKGYVETLLVEAAEGPRHVRDFLEIISKHANRLQAIVEDLLTLATIEQQGEQDAIHLTPGNIKNVLQDAIEACSPAAAAKNILVKLQCDDDLTAQINGPLLEQALINLLDNAIKYSDQNSVVFVETDTADDFIRILVRDTGIGMAPHHLPRLFERFYIVDKARSRKLGGTGLGLAIVKHIVQAHGGQVSVTSEPGKGSTFTLHIPNTS